MARGGYRPGAGRPKKSEEKTDTCETEIEPRFDESRDGEQSLKRTPLEHMLAVMNDPMAEDSRRDRMAIAAAPFIHAKPSEAGKKESRAEAAKEAAAGKFAPGVPPKLVVNNG